MTAPFSNMGKLGVSHNTAYTHLTSQGNQRVWAVLRPFFKSFLSFFLFSSSLPSICSLPHSATPFRFVHSCFFLFGGTCKGGQHYVKPTFAL